MKTVRRPGAVRRVVRAWRAMGETVGFVPTMGALHEGHRALLNRARGECDRLVASIFVNPLQFAPHEDLARYPRPIAADRRMLIAEHVDLLYQPDRSVLYPPGHETRVIVPRLSLPMEGEARPGHFDGVATVVAKLLAAVEPDRLYLGQKDAQQAAVLKRMARDLDFATRVAICPTIREKDGLACSSRNVYLSVDERRWSPALYRTLRTTAARLRSGEIAGPRGAEGLMRRLLARGPGRLDYARAVDPETLAAPSPEGPILLALAYRLPKLRLIDNLIVNPGRAR